MSSLGHQPDHGRKHYTDPRRAFADVSGAVGEGNPYSTDPAKAYAAANDPEPALNKVVNAQNIENLNAPPPRVVVDDVAGKNSALNDQGAAGKIMQSYAQAHKADAAKKRKK